VHWFVVRPLSSLWCFSFSAGAPLFPIQPIQQLYGFFGGEFFG